MARSRIQEVLQIPFPTTTKELRRVLGVTNYMRRFIPHYSTIVAPLTALVNSKNKELKNPLALEAFQELLRAVDSQLEITHLNYDLPIVVSTDASLRGVGGILSNIYDDGSERVVACCSHKFSAAEANWKTIEQEAFGVVYCLQHWYEVLWGAHFLLRTDHRNLLFVHGGTSAKVVRWSLLLQGLSFGISHIAGEDNWLPDQLSRYPVDHDAPVSISTGSPDSVTYNWSPVDSDGDEDYRYISTSDFEEEEMAPSLLAVKTTGYLDGEIFTEEPNLSVKSVRKQPPRAAKKPTTQTTIPDPQPFPFADVGSDATERRALISRAHNSTVGHHGINRTLRLLRQQGHNWRHIARDVTQFIAACAFCQKDRLSQPPAAAVLGQLATYSLFEELSIDFIGPLPVDTLGNCYIFNAECMFSHFAELIPTEAATAVIAAHCLLGIVSRYGCFRRIRSDQGTHFVNQVVQEFLQLFEIQSVLTLAERPQANGMVERQGGEVMRHLRALVFDAKTKHIWSLLLPLAQRILNSTYRQSIGCTPNSLVYVCAPDLDRDLFEPFRETTALAPVTTRYMKQLIEAHESLLDLTSLHVDKEQANLRQRYELTVPTEFPVDSLVLVSYLTRPTSKLHTRKAGPFLVVSRRSNVVTIRNLTNGDEKDVDVSRLTRFISEGNLSDFRAIAAADLGEVEVDAITAVEGDPRRRQSLTFEVQWSDGEVTWEPWDNVRRLAALDEFILANPSLKLNSLLSKKK